MNREFLYELLETASVSGFEEEIQRKVIKYARGFADEVYTDEIADVVSIVNPDAKIKVMLSAHMDEIGLMVSHITEKGMLHVSKAGGIYPGTYLGQKVRIMHEGNVVYGAVRNHGSLNKKELEITDIIIDIGAVSREDAMAHVACGDPVSFDTDYRELLNDRLCARGLDDRLGGYIILEAGKKAKERRCTCGIYAATTVGEEQSTELPGVHPESLRLWLLCLMLHIPAIMREQEPSKTEKSFWEADLFSSIILSVIK